VLHIGGISRHSLEALQSIGNIQRCIRRIHLKCKLTSAIFVTLIATNRLGTGKIFVIAAMRSGLARNQSFKDDMQLYASDLTDANFLLQFIFSKIISRHRIYFLKDFLFTPKPYL
jgi:hypothetical protein